MKTALIIFYIIGCLVVYFFGRNYFRRDLSDDEYTMSVVLSLFAVSLLSWLIVLTVLGVKFGDWIGNLKPPKWL